MTVEAAIEQTIKDAIQAAATAAGLTVQFRCWWLDDEEDEDREDATAPLLSIICRPWVPGEVPTIGTAQVGLAVVTAFQEDPKRTAMAALYAAMRSVFDANEWTSPEEPLNSIETVITDGDTMADVQERRNVVTLAVEAEICVDLEA